MEDSDGGQEEKAAADIMWPSSGKPRNQDDDQAMGVVAWPSKRGVSFKKK